MAKWIRYSMKDSYAQVGFLDLDQVGIVSPSTSAGVWSLRVSVAPYSYLIATGSGVEADAMAAFEDFLAGDASLPGA